MNLITEIADVLLQAVVLLLRRYVGQVHAVEPTVLRGPVPVGLNGVGRQVAFSCGCLINCSIVVEGGLVGGWRALC